MSELSVRNHNQPCEHGYTTSHGRMWGPTECPGGREIVLFKTTVLSIVVESGRFKDMDIYVVGAE